MPGLSKLKFRGFSPYPWRGEDRRGGEHSLVGRASVPATPGGRDGRPTPSHLGRGSYEDQHFLRYSLDTILLGVTAAFA